MLQGLVGRTGAALLGGVPVGTLTFTVGNVVVCVSRAPGLIRDFYRMLWEQERIGPNLKTAVSLAAPAAAAALPPLVLIGSAAVGAGHGFYRGFMSLGETYPKTRELTTEYVAKAIDSLQEEMKSYRPKLRPGQEPFDIRIVEALKGLAAGHLIAPAEAAGLALTLLRHWPRAHGQTRKLIWQAGEDRSHGDSPLRFLAKLGAAAAADGFTVLAVLAVPLTPLLGYLFGFGDSFVEGYRRGLRSAVSQAKKRVSQWNDLLKKFPRGD